MPLFPSFVTLRVLFVHSKLCNTFHSKLNQFLFLVMEPFVRFTIHSCAVVYVQKLENPRHGWKHGAHISHLINMQFTYFCHIIMSIYIISAILMRVHISSHGNGADYIFRCPCSDCLHIIGHIYGVQLIGQEAVS